MVTYSCPQYGARSWTHPDQPLDCPECVLVGQCPPHPMMIIINFYQYSLFLIIIVTHDLSPVTSSRHPTPLMTSWLLYILGPITSFFSIVTDKDLRDWNVLHFNLFQLLCDCSTIVPPPTYAVAMCLYQIIQKCIACRYQPNWISQPCYVCFNRMLWTKDFSFACSLSHRRQTELWSAFARFTLLQGGT